jgi:hypothetical protein
MTQNRMKRMAAHQCCADRQERFSTRTVRIRASVSGALVILGVGAAAATAVTGADDTPISGCVGPTGNLRVIEAPAGCKAPESSLKWNRQGPAGPQGPQGEKGPAGPQGQQGEAGPEGTRGAPGEKGVSGPKGDAGPQGAPGPAGENGDKGDRGERGETGAAGPAGPAGTTGQSAFSSYGAAALTPTSATQPVPGLLQTVSVPANSTVYITTDGGVMATGGTSTRPIVHLSLNIDGAPVGNGGYRQVSPEGTTVDNWTMAVTANLSAGTHQISVAASQPGGTGSALVSENNNSVLQGALSVVILKR